MTQVIEQHKKKRRKGIAAIAKKKVEVINLNMTQLS